MRELNEERVIALFKEVIGEPGRRYPRIGDDVTWIPHRRGKAVLKCDMLVASTDMPPQMSLWQASRKALIMTASDLLAKGVRPEATIISLGLPRSYSEGQVRELARGVRIGKEELGIEFLGGDTNEAGELIIDCTMIGFADRVISRSGARAGDLVFVTGPFGLTGAGLKILLDGLAAETDFRDRAINSVLLPRARKVEGVSMGKKALATASIDSSDGLALSLYHLAEESGVSVKIDALPIADGVLYFARNNQLDENDLILHAGEEYELVFSSPRLKASYVERTMKSAGSRAIRIGSVEKGKPLVYLDSKVVERKGWQHLA